MDAASSGVLSPNSITSSTDATGSSVGGSTSTDTSDSGIAADTVSFVVSSANEKFTAAASKVKMKMDMRKEDFSISKIGDSVEWSITGASIGTDTLIGYKRLEFEDGVLALDTDQVILLVKHIDCIKQLLREFPICRELLTISMIWKVMDYQLFRLLVTLLLLLNLKLSMEKIQRKMSI